MDEKEYLDYLTGISNRMGLFHLFEQLDCDMSVGVMFMDLDNFKTINDTYGHKKGDEVLIRFTRLIEEALPKNTIISRLGGDEFAAVLLDDSSVDYCISMAQRILGELRDLKNQDLVYEIISSSIGILQDYKVANGLDGALNCADKAMYFAKEQGKNTYIVYSDFEKQVEFESGLEKDLVNAMNEGRIIVSYHPVHNIQTSRLVSTEACCQWITVDGQILGRNDFRSILQKSGLILELDIFVFEQVCKEYEEWGHIQNMNHHVCIQISHLIFLDETRIQQIKDILTKYKVNPACIEINVDESMFSTRIMPQRLIAGMKVLKEMGVSLGLSHFGEDFSSVRYLKELPISKLDMDGDFILENLKDEDGARVFRGVTRLGRGFKFSIVACHADDRDQLMALAACGCDAATGSFYSPKLSLEDYVKYMEKHAKDDEGIVSFRFLKDFSADRRCEAATVIGEKIELTQGISSGWGAVSFPGGPCRTNLLKLSPSLFNGNGYSFSMWIKPRTVQEWVSALYVRYQDGFMSFMPNVFGGRCMLRTLMDAKISDWHDAMTGSIPVDKWTFVACTYDVYTMTARIYINGMLQSTLCDVPVLENPQEVWLGGDVFQESFNGLISGFQVNQTPMDGEEILKLYNGVRPVLQIG